MKRRTLCILALVMLFAPAMWTQPAAPAAPNAAPATAGHAPGDIVGTWQGTLRIAKTDQHPELDLRLVFKISRTDAMWTSRRRIGAFHSYCGVAKIVRCGFLCEKTTQASFVLLYAYCENAPRPQCGWIA